MSASSALAVSTPVKSIWAIPGDVELSAAQHRKLAALLGLDTRALQKRLADATREFVYLKRQVSPDAADAIAALGLKGIYQHREFRRYYPGGELTAHVIGFTGVDDVGQEGIELAFQAQLAGKAGARRVLKDRLGRIVEDVESIRAAQDGNVVVAASEAESGGYGNFTCIDHGGGLQTCYAHQSSFAITSGSVSQGDVIGYVGCTGHCFGDHLHFEVRVNGAAVDPMGYL